MVKRALHYVTKELSGLHEAAFLLALFSLISQVIGLLRDRLLASHFGAGESLDLYYAAFRIPDLIYVSVASFVAVTVLVPFIYDRESRGVDAIRDYLSGIATAFGTLIFLVAGVAYIAMPFLASYFVPGFSAALQDSYTHLARILLLSPMILGISNLFGAITQAGRRFFTYAVAPVVYNVGIVIGIVFFVPHYGVTGLAYGVILGALLHAGIQLPAVIAQRLLPRVTFRIDWKDVRALFLLSLPRTSALALNQIAMMVLIGLASLYDKGAIAIFTFATNLHNIPLMIVGSSYAVAAFPTLARHYNSGDLKAYVTQMIRASQHIVFWSLPALVFFIVLRAQIVRTVLGGGAFDWPATRLTAATLAIMIIGLLAHGLVLLMARGYYAMGNTRTPLYYNFIGSATIVISAIVFRQWYLASPTLKYFLETILRVDSVQNTIVLTLGLAYAIGMIVNVTLYWISFRRMYPEFGIALRPTILHSFASSVLGGYAAYLVLQVLAPILPTNTLLGIAAQGCAAGIVGVIAWIAMLKLLENRELADIMIAFRGKYWKTSRPIAGEQEEL